MLNDWGLIEEFGGFDEDPEERLAKLHALGDEVGGSLSARCCPRPCGGSGTSSC